MEGRGTIGWIAQHKNLDRHKLGGPVQIICNQDLITYTRNAYSLNNAVIRKLHTVACRLLMTECSGPYTTECSMQTTIRSLHTTVCRLHMTVCRLSCIWACPAYDRVQPAHSTRRCRQSQTVLYARREWQDCSCDLQTWPVWEHLRRQQRFHRVFHNSTTASNTDIQLSETAFRAN